MKLTPWRNDLPDQIKVDMLNGVVEDYAAEVRKELGFLSCKRHPLETSHITIMADRTKTMLIKKNFCCTDFEQQVSAKIER